MELFVLFQIEFYGIHDPKRIALLTQLRVWLSVPRFHKFRRNLNDSLNPLCPINDGVEDTEHFLLHSQSRDLNSSCSFLHSIKTAGI